MHTIKLLVGDKIYYHLISFLKNLKSSEIKIVEDKKEEKAKEINFSKYKINAFKNIKNPLEWQNEIRSEWDR